MRVAASSRPVACAKASREPSGDQRGNCVVRPSRVSCSGSVIPAARSESACAP
jgi:hypothetical protein